MYRIRQADTLANLARLYYASPVPPEMVVRDGLRAEARPALVGAIADFVSGATDVAEFRKRMDSFSKQEPTNHWGAGGIGFQMFFNLLVRYVPREELEPALRQAALAPPLDQAAARFNDFADALGHWRDRLRDQVVLPYKSVHFFLSFLWHLQQPHLYPVSFPNIRDAVEALVRERVLEVGQSPPSDGEGYMGLRQLHLDLAELLDRVQPGAHGFEDVEHLLYFMGRPRYAVRVADVPVWGWCVANAALALHCIEDETREARALLGWLSKLAAGDLVVAVTGDDQVAGIAFVKSLHENHAYQNGLQGWFGQRIRVRWIRALDQEGVPLSAAGDTVPRLDELPIRPIGFADFGRLGVALLDGQPQPLAATRTLDELISQLEAEHSAYTLDGGPPLTLPEEWQDGPVTVSIRPVVKGVLKAGAVVEISSGTLELNATPDAALVEDAESYRIRLVSESARRPEPIQPRTEPAREPAVQPAEPVRLALRPKELATGELELPERLVEQVCAALNAGKHLMLSGPPGTGKTSLAALVANAAARQGICAPPLMVTATANWSTFDTLGGYVPTHGGGLEFRPGLFLRALRERRWLIIDELNRADIDKAFGEFFSLLTGQMITLPFQMNGRPVVVVPPDQVRPPEAEVYQVPPVWRLIGTMNVYDKASLFQLSYAFMRRFAFVDVGIPSDEKYGALVGRFFKTAGGGALDPQVADVLVALFSHQGVLRIRELGPAILKDVMELFAALGDLSAAGPMVNLAEAVSAYILPQLEGLEARMVEATAQTLRQQFKESSAWEVIEHRLREMFPYVKLA